MKKKMVMRNYQINLLESTHAGAKISEDSNNISTDEEGQPPAKQAWQMADEDCQVELLILLWAFIVIWFNSNYIFLEYDTDKA